MGAATDQALARLLNQFSDRPNIQALLTDVFARVEDTNAILDDLLNLRDINTATGVWLDILGDIVGVVRPEREISADYIFAFKQDPGDPDDPNKAFYDPGGPTGGYYQSYEGLKDPSGALMIDAEYRELIKAKAIGNHSVGTIEDITRFILQGFGVASHITDETPGEIEVELVSGLTQGERRAVERYAPNAAGTSITIKNWP